MIANFFKDLLELPGIQAVVIFNSDNHILDSYAKGNFNTQILNDLGTHLQQVFILGRKKRADYPEMVMEFEKGQLFVKHATEFMIVVIVKRKIEVSLVRLIVDVGISEAESSKRLAKVLKKIPRIETDFFHSELLDDVEKDYLDKLD